MLEPGSNATILVRTWGQPQPNPRLGQCLLYTGIASIVLSLKITDKRRRKSLNDVIEMRDEERRSVKENP